MDKHVFTQKEVTEASMEHEKEFRQGSQEAMETGSQDGMSPGRNLPVSPTKSSPTSFLGVFSPRGGMSPNQTAIRGPVIVQPTTSGQPVGYSPGGGMLSAKARMATPTRGYYPPPTRGAVAGASLPGTTRPGLRYPTLACVTLESAKQSSVCPRDSVPSVNREIHSSDETSSLDESGLYKGKAKTKTVISFIADASARTKRFHKRAKVVIETVEELVKQTNANVKVEMIYEGPRKKVAYFFPQRSEEQTDSQEDDGREETSSSTLFPGSGTLKQVVKEGFTEVMADYQQRGMTPVQRVLGLDANADRGADSDSSMRSESSQQSESAMSFQRRSGRAALPPGACFLCKETTDVVRDRYGSFNSKLLHCAAQPCLARVHYSCIGLPHFEINDQLENQWYCSAHVAVARSSMPFEHPGSPETDVAPGRMPFNFPGQRGNQKKRGRPPLSRTVVSGRENQSSRGRPAQTSDQAQTRAQTAARGRTK